MKNRSFVVAKFVENVLWGGKRNKNKALEVIRQKRVDLFVESFLQTAKKKVFLTNLTPKISIPSTSLTNKKKSGIFIC